MTEKKKAMIYLVTKDESFKSKYPICSVQFVLDTLGPHKSVQVDTETGGFDEHTKDILSLQLGTPTGSHQFVIDTDSVNIQDFKQMLEGKALLLQNAKFDLKFLYKNNIYPKRVHDTFLAECVLTTGLRERSLGLDALAFKYLDVVLDKSVRGEIHREGLSDRVIRYGADDVKYLYPIYNLQMQRIKKENLQHTLSLEEQYVKVLAYTEHCGFKLDPDKWLANSTNNEKKLEKQIEVLNKMLIDHDITMAKEGELFSEVQVSDINWKSTKQVTKLMQLLGVDTKIKIRGTEKDSIEAKHLKKFKHKHAIIPEYLKFSELSKQVSTYGEQFLKHINGATGRLHSNYWQI